MNLLIFISIDNTEVLVAIITRLRVGTPVFIKMSLLEFKIDCYIFRILIKIWNFPARIHMKRNFFYRVFPYFLLENTLLRKIACAYYRHIFLLCLFERRRHCRCFFEAKRNFFSFFQNSPLIFIL